MKRWGLTICLGSLAWSTPAAAADPLPSFVVDLAESSVSGLSSGAYMAGQFHVAFSGSLKGAVQLVADFWLKLGIKFRPNRRIERCYVNIMW